MTSLLRFTPTRKSAASCSEIVPASTASSSWASQRVEAMDPAVGSHARQRLLHRRELTDRPREGAAVLRVGTRDARRACAAQPAALYSRLVVMTS